MSAGKLSNDDNSVRTLRIGIMHFYWRALWATFHQNPEDFTFMVMGIMAHTWPQLAHSADFAVISCKAMSQL